MTVVWQSGVSVARPYTGMALLAVRTFPAPAAAMTQTCGESREGRHT